jgi:hypothetical protein
LYNPDGQDNVLFAAWKRIVSGRARIAPFLTLNYRDARTVMIQNANGMKPNDRMELKGIIPIKLQVSHLKEASGMMGKLFLSI